MFVYLNNLTYFCNSKKHEIEAVDIDKHDAVIVFCS
jgi:hypothetical protein